MLTSSPPPPEIVDALDRGERVLWSGQPRQGLAVRAADALLIPFSLLWGGLALFAAWSAFHRRDPVGMLVTTIFSVIGLYVIAGRFCLDAAQRRRTWYAVTNERILIVSGFQGRNIKSLPLRTLDQIDVSSRVSGRGTIMFGRSAYGWIAVPGWPGMGKYLPPMFEFIPDAAEVGRLVRDAQRSANARSSAHSPRAGAPPLPAQSLYDDSPGLILEGAGRERGRL